MEKKESKPTGAVAWRIKQWFPELTNEEDRRLKLFADELVKANSLLSLVSLKSVSFIDAIHFADCISGCRLIHKNSNPSSLIDFGSGNGLPGVVFAILYPSTMVHCVDRDKRKCEFLSGVAALLGLKNLKVSVLTVESIADSSWGHVVSRGAGPISKAILTLLRPIKKGGIYYFFKGEEWATEVAQIPSQLCKYWQPELVGEYKLPLGEMRFSVIRLNKIND